MFNAIDIPTRSVEPMLVPQAMDLFGYAPIRPASQPKKGMPLKIVSVIKPECKKAIATEIDDFAEGDEESAIDLEVFEGDSSDTFLAKRMFSRMLCDLSGEVDSADPDLFGHIEGTREQRKQDALIWMFALNPDGSEVPFEWVCNEIGFDAERVRRITGRSVRQDLKRILKLLSSMVSNAHAKTCELNLMDYVNLSGWQLN